MAARAGIMAALAGLAVGACSSPPVEADLPFRPGLCVRGLDALKTEGVQIPVGGCVISPSGAYAMVMHDTGMLDLAPVGPDGRRGAPVWTSGVAGARLNSAVGVFQPDGNLVVYDQPDNRPIWNSASVHPIGDYRLEVADQGEILIRPAGGEPVWSSRRGAIPAPAP